MASIFFRTAIIYILLTVVLKLMGKRQIGELEISELVSTLLISEIAALPIDDPDIPLLSAVIPILFILSLEIIISAAKNRSHALKQLIEGRPICIIRNGKVQQDLLRENRISINELLSEMRLQGIGDISDVSYAILEQSGKISMIKSGSSGGEQTSSSRSGVRDPTGGSDGGQSGSCDGGLAHSVILDGAVEEGTLRILGYNEVWLRRALGNKAPDEVFLMTVDDNGKVNIILKEENPQKSKEGGG